jgi:hypothetical protein
MWQSVVALILMVTVVWNIPTLASWVYHYSIALTEDLLILAHALARIVLRIGFCIVCMYLVNRFVILSLALLSTRGEMVLVTLVGVLELAGPAALVGPEYRQNHATQTLRTENGKKKWRKLKGLFKTPRAWQRRFFTTASRTGTS